MKKQQGWFLGLLLMGFVLVSHGEEVYYEPYSAAWVSNAVFTSTNFLDTLSTSEQGRIRELFNEELAKGSEERNAFYGTMLAWIIDGTLDQTVLDSAEGARIARIDEEIGSVELDLTAKEEEIQSANDNIDSKENEISAAETQIDEINDEIEDLNSDIADLEEDNSDMLADNEVLQDKIEAARSVISEKEEEIRELICTIATLQADWTAHKAQQSWHIFCWHCRTFRNQISRKEKSIVDRNNIISRKNADIDKYNAKIAANVSEQEANDAEIDRIQTVDIPSKEEIQRVIREETIPGYREEIEVFNDQIVGFTDELDELNDDLLVLEGERNATPAATARNAFLEASGDKGRWILLNLCE